MKFTFQKLELLEKSGRYKGITEIQEQATEEQSSSANVNGVRPGANKTNRHLFTEKPHKKMICFMRESGSMDHRDIHNIPTYMMYFNVI